MGVTVRNGRTATRVKLRLSSVQFFFKTGAPEGVQGAIGKPLPASQKRNPRR